MFSLERGDTSFQLHAQGVIRIEETSAGNVTKLMHKFLGWDSEPKLSVRTKTLTGHDMHCFTGMLGYCTKDRNKPWYETVSHNVTDEQIAAGQDLHLQYGAPKCNRVELHMRNLFTRALTYYTYSEHLNERRLTLTGLLTTMMRSGKFMPSAGWVAPYQGSGMDHRRACALWKMLITPDQTEAADIHNVFFKQPGRYFHDTADSHVLYEDEQPTYEETLVGPRPRKRTRCAINNPNCDCLPATPDPPSASEPVPIMKKPVTTSHYEQINPEIDDNDTQLCDVVVDRSHNSNINLPTADFLPFDM